MNNPEKTEGEIKNEQSRETMGTRHRTKTTQHEKDEQQRPPPKKPGRGGGGVNPDAHENIKIQPNLP